MLSTDKFRGVNISAATRTMIGHRLGLPLKSLGVATHTHATQVVLKEVFQSPSIRSVCLGLVVPVCHRTCKASPSPHFLIKVEHKCYLLLQSLRKATSCSAQWMISIY